MLTIEFKDIELWDERNERFISIKGGIAKMEDSLAALAEWEELYGKPFYDSEKTKEEKNKYLYCMVLNKEDIDERLFDYLSNENIKKINDYIYKPHTATRFYTIIDREKGSSNSELMTAESIYYCMSELNIDYECQYWNIKRLQTLIKFIIQKHNASDDKNKLTRQETLEYYKELNRKRRAELKEQIEKESK